MSERDWTRLRWALAAVMALSASVVLLFVHGRGVDAGLNLLGLLVCALWALPSALYAAAVRTRAGTLLLGVGLALATASLLHSIYTSDSSTAAIGLVVAPVELGFLAALGVGVDACGQAYQRRRTLRLGGQPGSP